MEFDGGCVFKFHLDDKVESITEVKLCKSNGDVINDCLYEMKQLLTSTAYVKLKGLLHNESYNLEITIRNGKNGKERLLVAETFKYIGMYIYLFCNHRLRLFIILNSYDRVYIIQLSKGLLKTRSNLINGHIYTQGEDSGFYIYHLEKLAKLKFPHKGAERCRRRH